MPYPDALDSFTNPSASDPRVGHALLHGDINDAVEALEAKVGSYNSTPDVGQVLLGDDPGVTFWVDLATAMNNFGNIRKATVTLSSADLLAVDTTPFVVVASPGAGKWLRIHNIAEYLTFGSSPYSAVSPPLYVYDKVGVYLTVGSVQTYVGSEDSVGGPALSADLNIPASGAVDCGLAIFGDGNALTGGDGTLTVNVWYSIEDVPA